MYGSTSIIIVFASFLLTFAAGCGNNGDGQSADSPAPVLGGPGPFAENYDEFTTTESGLKYRITREGDGEKPASTDAVKVHYRGMLADGSEFDSSYKRREPLKFPLSDVIPGWTEGMQLVKVGGMIELIIPPDLGYGAKKGGPIPPNSTLYFTVELLDLRKPTKQSEPTEPSE